MKEPVKITKKIVGYKVVTEEGVTKIPDEQGVTYINPTDTLVAQLEELAELETTKDIAFKTAEAINLVIKPALKRPLRLDNEWRLKPPYANHALYVRLNAITHEGKKYPYEIFFNTKEVKDIKWLNALTVTISTAFRTAIETGTSLQSLIDNFKESCDTESPYLSRVPEKPKFVNGLVAEIGLVIEEFNKECLAWNYSESSHERPATEEEAKAVTTLQDTTQFKMFMEEQEEEPAFFGFCQEVVSETSTKEVDISISYKVITNPCPDCGSQLTKQSGCDMCTCGYSKCG